MSNNTVQEIVASLVLLTLLTLLVNPWGLWMSSPLVMMLLIGFAIVFALFASFVWREKVRDEREGLHRMLAGRMAFLVGAGMLVLGIMVQSWRHALDPWLALTLGAMIVAKIIGRIYSRIRY